MKTILSVLCFAVVAVMIMAGAASAHSRGYKQKINAVFYTPKKIGTFLCRIKVAGQTRTSIVCGPIRQQ